MRTILNFIFSTLLFLFVSSVFAQETKVLKQENSPLEIKTFSAVYQLGGTSYSSEGIRYTVFFVNKTDKEIVAYAINFLAFDVFNRRLGRALEGYSVSNVKVTGDGSWIYRTNSASLFKKYGTAIAYVSYIRFDDGTIWKYNQSEVLNQLNELYESLTIDDIIPE